MLLPTLPIKLIELAGHDLYGQPKLKKPVDERCSPVRLDFESQNTTVRTDSGATHGHAHEGTAKVVILVLATTKAEVGWLVQFPQLGHTVRITKKHPRYRVTGALDHYQLECEAWA